MADSYELDARLLNGEEAQEPERSAPPKSWVQRNQVPLVVACLLVAVAATIGVLAGAHVFSSKNHNNANDADSFQASSSAPAGFQAVPAKSRHPLFSTMPKPQMVKGSEPGLLYSKVVWSYSDTDDRLTTVNYEAEHRENITVPETIPGLIGLNCSSGSKLRIAVNSTMWAPNVSQQFPVGAIVPMGGGWFCGEHIRQVAGQPVVEGNVVHVPTKNVTVEQVFKTAHISIHTRYNNATETAAEAARLASTPREHLDTPQRRRRGIFGFFKHIWNDAKTFVEGVFTAGKLLVTGQLVVPTKDTKLWQYTFGPQACLSGLSQEEASCSFSADLETIVELNIENWQLQSLELAIQGDASAHVGSNVNVGKTFTSSGSEVAFHDKLWGATIMIGSFPLPLTIYGRITLSHDLSLTPSFSFSGSAQAQGQVTYGIQYDKSNGWNFIKDHSLSKSGQISTLSAEVTAHAGFGVTPQLYLQAAYIGGPFVQMTFEADLDAQVNVGTGGGSCSDGADVSIDGDFDIGIGAKIDIEIAHHTLYQHQWEVSVYDSPEERLASGCFH